MKFDKIYNKGQARLFRSEILETLTKAPPLLIWSMYLPLVIYMVYFSGVRLGVPGLLIAVIFVLGMFSWTLVEYLIHRYIFHKESERPAMKRFIYLLHGNHHHFPRDRERLFMPPVPSLLIACTLFGLFYLVMRSYVFMFFPGFVFGYLLYGSMHYLIHAGNPPFKWMKPLWRNHHLHHYRHEDKGFGVSSTLWDHVFNTRFDLKKEKDDEEKVRELMFDDK